MQPVKTPLILYIPGLLPKPAADVHKAALFRCLIAGVRKAEPAVADLINAQSHSFDLVAWTYDFYLEHRDIALDAAGGDTERFKRFQAGYLELISQLQELLLAILAVHDDIAERIKAFQERGKKK